MSFKQYLLMIPFCLMLGVMMQFWPDQGVYVLAVLSGGVLRAIVLALTPGWSK